MTNKSLFVYFGIDAHIERRKQLNLLYINSFFFFFYSFTCNANSYLNKYSILFSYMCDALFVRLFLTLCSFCNSNAFLKRLMSLSNIKFYFNLVKNNNKMTTPTTMPPVT